jgi:seryl-tRNA synthetase
MLDIKFIRENPDLVKKLLSTKNEKFNIDIVLQLDEKKRKILFEYENLKSEQNRVSKEIGKLKNENKSANEQLIAMHKIIDHIKDLEHELNIVKNELDSIMLGIPNLPDSSVKIGKSEADNVVIKTSGEIINKDFIIKEHQEIAVEKGILDFHRGAKLTGSGFPVYIGKGAILERALINFMLDFHIIKHGYTEVKVPFIVNRETMTGTGQLPKLENDMYFIREDDFFLIPTAEVPVTNLYAQEIISSDNLPLKYVCYTPCFRKEAGSYGKDTKGLQRIHQFNKVEMVRFVKPEDSAKTLDEMLQDAEEILQALVLPYRVLELCTGDMSFASNKTFDLEVWSPATQKYLEVSSVSNFIDFQARRANIRYRDSNGKVRFVHTLNGSGLATPRTMVAILENYQQEDGSIIIPEVLKPYMNGIDKI